MAVAFPIRLQVRRKRAALRNLQESPEGRILFKILYRYCGVGTDIHVPGDPYTTAYNAGRRSVWDMLQTYIHMDEDALLRLGRPDEEETA